MSGTNGDGTLNHKGRRIESGGKDTGPEHQELELREIGELLHDLVTAQIPPAVLDSARKSVLGRYDVKTSSMRPGLNTKVKEYKHYQISSDCDLTFASPDYEHTHQEADIELGFTRIYASSVYGSDGIATHGSFHLVEFPMGVGEARNGTIQEARRLLQNNGIISMPVEEPQLKPTFTHTDARSV